MKLEQLTPVRLREALDAFVGIAYPDGGAPDLPVPAESLEVMLKAFTDETPERGGQFRRFTLRLGSAGYPFMKVVLQEHLIKGEYFLVVDTHDDLDIKEGFPDYADWIDLKAANRVVKGKVERRWAKEGLPTAAKLAQVVADASGRTARLRRLRTEARILVVDDEKDVAKGVKRLLETQRWRVDVALDGAEALRKAKRKTPDLVLLDFGLPDMDGLQVLEALRADASTEDVPILLATARQLPLEVLGRANGFLIKPFEGEILFSLIRNLMSA